MMFGTLTIFVACFLMLAASQTPQTTSTPQATTRQPAAPTKPSASGNVQTTPAPQDHGPTQPPAKPQPSAAPAPKDSGTTQPADQPESPTYEVVASPNPCLPGQTVAFCVPPGVEKITVRGGRFTRPTVVTDPSELADSPLTPTTYVFDVWYTK